MQKEPLSNDKKRLGLLILLAIFIPITSFFIGYFYGQMESKGMFVQWHSLGTPPNKISKLRGICNNRLCVETMDQKIYIAPPDCLNGLICPNEDKSKPIPWKEEEKTIKIEIPVNRPCRAFIVANPPGDVAQSVEEKTCNMYTNQQTSYILLQDGSVWSWDHTEYVEEQLVWVLLYGRRAFFIGMIIWLVIAVIFIWVDERPSKSLFSTQSNPSHTQNHPCCAARITN